MPKTSACLERAKAERDRAAKKPRILKSKPDGRVLVEKFRLPEDSALSDVYNSKTEAAEVKEEAVPFENRMIEVETLEILRNPTGLV